ncbi:MAG TPA: TM2 domain-containing protein [Verrucomicrobiae bacterium]
MSKPGPFHLRWRGQVSGPFSHAEIQQKLEDHEIGLWHEIGHAGEWTTLGEFLEQEDRERAAAAPPPAPTGDAGPPAVQPQRVHVGPATSAATTPASESASEPINDTPPPAAGPAAKSLKLFVALGALLGFTGAHNFYAGYRGTAIAQLVLTGVTLALGFGLMLSWLWALIELVIVHSDARGIRMR